MIKKKQHFTLIYVLTAVFFVNRGMQFRHAANVFTIKSPQGTFNDELAHKNQKGLKGPSFTARKPV